jgi:hypothetical protein
LASRFGQKKPDPAIKRNVRWARDRQARHTDPRAIIAMASVTATLVASTAFAYQGSAVSANAQAGGSAQTITATSSQSAGATGATGTSAQNGLLPVPTVAPLASQPSTSGAQDTSTAQNSTSSQSTSTQVQLPQVTLPSVSIQLPSPFTSTRSSR